MSPLEGCKSLSIHLPLEMTGISALALTVAEKLQLGKGVWMASLLHDSPSSFVKLLTQPL